ncbi:MAG: flagellar biosynthetic protein FliR [Candidatus Brocadiaceae baterium WH-1]|nr:MAG: flagellar biosynthetic protein FliR [Candidatus Jettenia sp. AMX2]
MMDLINLLSLFTIVLFRTASVLFFSPIYSQTNMPLILKIGLAMVITFAIFPAISSEQEALPKTMAGYIVLIFKEISIGFLIGYTVTLAFVHLP